MASQRKTLGVLWVMNRSRPTPEPRGPDSPAPHGPDPDDRRRNSTASSRNPTSPTPVTRMASARLRTSAQSHPAPAPGVRANVATPANGTRANPPTHPQFVLNAPARIGSRPRSTRAPTPGTTSADTSTPP
ncbi:hypothetical protein ABZX85_41395 [Streptomyces sp. NPDC004539]|uniref:hypothetical protein n=1 Tax=Streptomyces sp. NPDC004539 TaxID=3154280 RepID=UPI0033BDD1BC